MLSNQFDEEGAVRPSMKTFWNLQLPEVVKFNVSTPAWSRITRAWDLALYLKWNGSLCRLRC